VLDITETQQVRLLLESLPSHRATSTKRLHFILCFLMPLSHLKYSSMSGFCLVSKQKLSVSVYLLKDHCTCEDFSLWCLNLTGKPELLH